MLKLICGLCCVAMCKQRVKSGFLSMLQYPMKPRQQ